jgi:LysR family transcriptional activator of mexEF-oprN operon
MKSMHDAYGRDLDLNLLRVFAVVAEEGSYTLAASRLYVTQPAVSAAMRRLTEFVGAALFSRQGRGVVLTTRGAKLAAAARAHLGPLVSAVVSVPLFDPTTSTATVRIGLADALESLLLPGLLQLLSAEAPCMGLVVLPVQFRTVEQALLSAKVDLAVTVADDLPRSILRHPLATRRTASQEFVCLYDPRFSALPKTLSEQDYFARHHVAVSYAGDVRGIIEDLLGKSRKVRLSVPGLGHVADVVEGTSLLATVPSLLARHILGTHPHLNTVPLPRSLANALSKSLESTTLDLLWVRGTDEDAAASFVRGLLIRLGEAEDARAGETAPVARKPRRK